MSQNFFSLPLLNERSPYAGILIDALLPAAQLKLYPAKTRLLLNNEGNKQCYILLTGTFKAYRSSDDLLIMTVQSPGMMGLAVHDAYIITSEPSEIATLSLEEVHRIITEKGLWETVSQHLMVLTNKLYSYSRQLSAPTVYEVICNQLIELMNEPESLRAGISVERYIREKTHISRSSVMKILADLKAGQYINIENGRLLEIRHLPQKY